MKLLISLLITLFSIGKISAQVFTNYGYKSAITAIASDRQGNRWITTEGEGLKMYNDTYLSIYTAANSPLPGDMLSKVVVDSNDVKWIATGYYGIFVKLEGLNNWTVYKSSNSLLPNEKVIDIAVDSHNTKWLLTGNGIYTFDDNTFKKESSKSFTAIAIDSKNNKWFCSGTKVTRYNDTTWTEYDAEDLGFVNISGLKRIAIDSKDGVWASSPDNGIIYFDGNTWKLFDYDHGGLFIEEVYDIKIDKSDTKWIGTREGVFTIDKQNISCTRIDSTDFNYTFFYNLHSQVVTPDNKGGVWIGAWGDLWHYSNHIYTVRYTSIRSSSRAIAVDKLNRKVCVVESFQGISIFNDSTWTSSDYEIRDRLNDVAVDGNNTWWFTSNEYLRSYDGNTWKAYKSNIGLGAIAIDKDGTKWIATHNSGLLKFSDTTWTWYNKSNSGIASHDIKSVVIDKKGNKWLGSGDSGLIKFDGTTWTTYKRTNSGLLDNDILSLALDNNDNLWIGLDNDNISYFDGSKWSAYTLPATIGTKSTVAIAIDKNNVKWFGVFEYGLVKFDGIKMTPYTYMPDNDITDVAVDDSNNIWAAHAYGVSTLKGDPIIKRVGIADIGHSKPFASAYPNPVKDLIKLKIGNPEYCTGYSVINILGSSVIEGRITDEEIKIDAASLTPGVYFIRFENFPDQCIRIIKE